MKVQLIKDIYEKDRFGNETLKVTRRRNRSWHPPKKQEDGSFAESSEPEFISVPFVTGREIEMSDASAEKYISQGLAKAVE